MGYSFSQDDNSTKALEGAINAKAGTQFGSSFSVGTGSTASSSPSLSGDSSGVPMSYVLIGGGVALLAVLIVVLKKK